LSLQSVTMPDAGVGRLESKLLKPQQYANLGSWVGCAIGLLIIIVATLIYLIRARKKNYST
jgi:hypothetical protein